MTSWKGRRWWRCHQGTHALVNALLGLMHRQTAAAYNHLPLPLETFLTRLQDIKILRFKVFKLSQIVRFCSVYKITFGNLARCWKTKCFFCMASYIVFYRNMKQWFCEVSSISDLKKDDQHWGWGWTSDMFEEMIKCQKDPLAVASHPDPGLRPLPLCPWCLPSPRDSRLPTEAVQGNESIPRRRISKTPNLLSALSTWPSKTVAWLSSGLVALCRKIRPFIVDFFPI